MFTLDYGKRVVWIISRQNTQYQCQPKHQCRKKTCFLNKQKKTCFFIFEPSRVLQVSYTLITLYEI